jgi:ligand-binding sensor domain-containing protein
MKFIFLFLTTLFLLTNISAQTFTNYTDNNGLIDNNVLCLDSDTADNVWFGTQYGISHFDGTVWTSYDTSSHSGLVDNNINAIMIASDDRIWVGTDFGVSVFDGTSFTSYTTADGLGNNRINDIAEDANGIIWFGEFSGATKYNGSVFTAYSSSAGLPFGGVNHVSFDSDNNVWFSTALGGLVKYDGTNFTSISTPQGLLHNVVRASVVDAQDNIWTGTAGGVSVVDTSGQIVEQHTRMYIMPAPDTLNPVEDIDMDSQGRIWVGVYVDYLVTVGGVAMYDGNQWIDYDESDGLVGPVIRQIDIDTDDNVWIATSSGVSKISNTPNALIEIAEQKANFKIFPNPASGFLNIEFENTSFSKNCSVSVFSTSMKLILRFNSDAAENRIRVPLDDLNPGLYFIQIDNESLKFIIH